MACKSNDNYQRILADVKYMYNVYTKGPLVPLPEKH